MKRALLYTGFLAVVVLAAGTPIAQTQNGGANADPAAAPTG